MDGLLLVLGDEIDERIELIALSGAKIVPANEFVKDLAGG